MYESAADAASPASFQPLKAHTITGARSSGRSRQITSVINLTVPDVRSGDHDWNVTIAELRPGGEVEGVFACTRKDRLTAQQRLALPGRRAARPDRRDPRPRVPRRRLPRRPVRARRPGGGERPRGALPRRAPGRAPNRSSAPPRRCRTRPSSCRWPTATWRSSTASSSTSRARSTTRTCAPCSTRSSATRPSAPSSGARPARAPATTPTSAACSSTPSRSPRSRTRPACSIPRLNSDLLITAAILHDVGKTLEFQLGAEIALSEAGALVGPRGARAAARRGARAAIRRLPRGEAARSLSLHPGSPRA